MSLVHGLGPSPGRAATTFVFQFRAWAPLVKENPRLRARHRHSASSLHAQMAAPCDGMARDTRCRTLRPWTLDPESRRPDDMDTPKRTTTMLHTIGLSPGRRTLTVLSKAAFARAPLVIAALISVLLASCRGRVNLDTGDAAPPGRDGAEEAQDANVAPRDGAGPAGDAAETLEDGSGNIRDAAIPERDAATPGPDAQGGPDASLGPCGTTCPENSYCDPATSTCVCLPGFAPDQSGRCQAPPPSDPAARTRDEMCATWRVFRTRLATTIWTPGPTDCDPGTLSTYAMVDAISAINSYRYLTGLRLLSFDAGLNEQSQYCAILEDHLSGLDHHPPADSECYTALGAGAAAASNLAKGPGGPADHIDLLVEDGTNYRLGHRRWILYPSYGPAGIGFAGSTTCQYVFSWNNTGPAPAFVAWPNQGFTPMEVFPTRWLWSFSSPRVTSATQVRVRRLSDGQELSVSMAVLQSGFGQETVGFRPSGWYVAADEVYEVTISSLSGTPSTVTYQVKPVTCP